jgi:hypothetical protein
MREIEIEAASGARPALAATEARYRRMVAEWAQGNETAEAVAARHGIAAGTLKWWRCELKRRDRGAARAVGSETELLPVRVTSPGSSTVPRTTAFEVVLCGGKRVVRIPGGFDPIDVRAVVEAVEGGPC